MKRTLPLVLALIIIVAFLVAPTRAAGDAPAVTGGYEPVAELVDPNAGPISVRGVAAVGDYAHVVFREGALSTFDVSALQDSPPDPSDPFVTVDDPVSNLSLNGFGRGILAHGAVGYIFGQDGLIVLEGLGTANPSPAGAPFSDRYTYNLIRHNDVLIAVGPEHVTLFDASDPLQPQEVNSRALGAGNTGFSAAVVEDGTLLVGQFASGAGGVSGIAVFDYTHPNLTPVTTIGNIDTPYHLHALGAQVVACNSDTIALWDFTFNDDPSQDDLFQGSQTEGRACILDGNRLIANGLVLGVAPEGFTFIGNFDYLYIQTDGSPHFSDVAGAFVFLAQSPRILLLTRPVPVSVPAASTPPAIDGEVSVGEWRYTDTVPFQYGFIAFGNDGERLYLQINVLDDTVADPADEVNISFDVNGDGAVTPFVDVNYHLTPQLGNLRPRYYDSPQTFGPDFQVYRSSRADGYGCSLVDGSLFLVPPQQIVCEKHVVWELAVNMDEIDAEPGDTVGMGIGVFSGSPQLQAELPDNYLYEFSNLIRLDLSDVIPLPPPDNGPAVPFQGNPLEVTQAVQTRDNTLPLAAGKDTAVRAYLNNSSGSPANLTVYLYGSRGGVDLPGSPLTVGFTAPTSVDRTQLNDTANFELPDSWIQAGTVQLYAVSRRWRGASSTSSTVTVDFQTRDEPLYWVVPVNEGSASSPVLPDNGDINDHESFLEAVYPVADVTYVRQPWTALGPNQSIGDPLIAELREYHGTAVLAWILGFIFTGSSPFDLPDQVYGFTDTAHGLSDPTWWNDGDGYVAYGGDFDDSLPQEDDYTMAHEINHNLDRSTTGTWGRHNGGCGADGPDPEWPYSNDDVNEIGFDTRPTWVNGVVGDRRTVITTDYPDFMSYCQHPNRPGGWISPYRWNNLFAFFAPGTAAANPATRRALAAAEGIGDVMYLSGYLEASGGGALAPALVQPGFPSADPGGSAYTIEIRNGSNNLLDSVGFDVVFEDLRGDPVDRVSFSFMVPDQPGVAAIQLKQGSTVLDEIAVSANAPTVTIQEPNGGEVWTGVETIAWTANDADGDPLTFTLLYSPDNGETWQPIAGGVTGSSYDVNAALLPGGAEGKIRIVASDGYNTTEANSSGTFTVPNQPPVASIDAPAPGAYLPADEAIHLQASAQDPEGYTLTDEDFVWKVDGELAAVGKSVDLYLPRGRYTVTLEATDDLDNPTTVSRVINVGPRDVFMPVIITQ